MGKIQNNELDDYTYETIHYKVEQLIGNYGFTDDDYDDLTQELTVAILRRLPAFRADRAEYNTFVSRVIDWKVIDLIRHQTSEKRDYRCEAYSLNEQVAGPENKPVPRFAMMEQDEGDIRIGKYKHTATERLELQLDVESVLADLPDELRQVAMMLQEKTITQVAQELGMPRTTFRNTYLVKLGEIFIAKGFEKKF